MSKVITDAHGCPEGHCKFAIYFDEPSLTKQSFKDECDINLIIDRARNGMDVSHVNARVAQYGDFSNVPDYRSASDLVNRANSMFMELDASIRERFANDPARLLDFLQNPKNRDEAIRLGIVEAPKPIFDDTPVSGSPRALPVDPRDEEPYFPDKKNSLKDKGDKPKARLGD